MEQIEKRVAVIAFTGQGRRLAQRLMAGLRQNDNALETSCLAGGVSRVVAGYVSAAQGQGQTQAQVQAQTRGQEQAQMQGPAQGQDVSDNLTPFSDLGRLAQELWPRTQALIFVGACGIAVRAIAPYVSDKTRDPAVLVLDENGQFVISLLSGHIGGANQLALEIAALIGAQPVITTATDTHHLFAADSWAIHAGLHIVNPQAIKKISGSLLQGRAIGLSSQYPINGPLPAGVEYFPSASGRTRPEAGVHISANAEEQPFSFTLHLMPKNLVLGCGCRRGAKKAQIRETVLAVLRRQGLSPSRLCLISSIDLKSGEPGLLDFAAEMGLPLAFFSAAQLSQAPGLFSSSAYVKKVTGVDNVCERSAVLGGLEADRRSGNLATAGLSASSADMGSPAPKTAGRLLIPKTSYDGVTIAVYERDFAVVFP
jgi:cobalt-precorrin 5A hydrolase